MAGGRKSVYEDKIKANFKYIEKQLKNGADEKQIAKNLGIASSTWFKYKAEKQEFSDFVKSVSRGDLVEDLRSALIKKALGFTYEEKKQYITEDENGRKKKHTELYTKQALPDVAAINLALKNYDKDRWSNDPALLDLKRQELELRKQAIEYKDW